MASIWNTSANAYNGAVGATAGLMQNNPMSMLNSAYNWAAQATGQKVGDGVGLKNPDGSINYFAMNEAGGGGGGGGGGFSASFSGPKVSANQLATTNFDPYMNPYYQQVLSGTLADLARQQSGVMNDIGAQASAAGAFGGSRHGLVESEANRNYIDTVGQQSAQMRSDAFNTAMQNAQFDISAKLQADMANQQAAVSMANAARSSGGGGSNAYNQMMMNAQLQREQMALGALTGQQDFNLKAAGQLADMSNLGFGMGNTINSNMMNAGAQQQAMYQNLFNSAAGQYGGWTGYPAQGLGYMNSSLQGIPNMSSTTTSQNPGLLGSLTGVSQGIGVIGGMFCWVARAAYGADNPKWLKVRQWMLTRAPKWLFNAYVKHGPKMAEWIERHPRSKPLFRAALGRLSGV